MGIQRSTYISVIFVLVAGTLGVLVGAISGYFGKWVDNVLMRIVDVILTVPILVAIIVVAANFPERPLPDRHRAVHRAPRLDGPGPDRAQLVPLAARA